MYDDTCHAGSEDRRRQAWFGCRYDGPARFGPLECADERIRYRGREIGAENKLFHSGRFAMIFELHPDLECGSPSDVVHDIAPTSPTQTSWRNETSFANQFGWRRPEHAEFPSATTAPSRAATHSWSESLAAGLPP